MVGNAAKAGVRFMSYDHFKHKLADAEVWRYFMSIKRWLRCCTGKNKCSKKSSWYPLFLILIYVGAERFYDQRVWAQAWWRPFLLWLHRKLSSMISRDLSCEPADRFGIFRTKLIDDAKNPNPRYRGLVHGTMSIVKQEGVFGIYRGLFPVVNDWSMHEPKRGYSHLYRWCVKELILLSGLLPIPPSSSWYKDQLYLVNVYPVRLPLVLVPSLAW